MQEEKEIKSSSSDPSEDIDWGRLFRRKDRPLPKPGCSIAFFIFLGILTAWLVFSYLQYQS